MKIPLPMIGLASLCGVALASSALAAPPKAHSPLLGKWELDLKRMPDTYGPPPKSVTYVFADLEQDMWQTTIDIVMPDGSVRHSVVRYRRDGQAVAGEGDRLEADNAAFSTPAPNILVMGLTKDKRPGSVRVYNVSANGREMTESAANVDENGMPFIRTFHYTRAPR